LQKDIVVQPGLNSTFPWLSNIALLYDRYKFLKLELEFITSCPTTTSGTVYMAFDPDALDQGPSSTSDMLQYKVNLQFSPFLTQKMAIGKSVMNKILYTRAPAQPLGNADLKTYDLGLFYVTTDNTVSGVALGTIRLNYTIQLMDPQPRADNSIGSTLQYAGSTSYTFNALYWNNMPNCATASGVATSTMQIKATGAYEFWWLNTTNTTVGTPTYTGGLVQTNATVVASSSQVMGIWYISATAPGTFTFPPNGTSLSVLVKTA